MAIVGMNGQWLGGRPLRTNWATGKGLAGQRSSSQQSNVLLVLYYGPVTNVCAGVYHCFMFHCPCNLALDHSSDAGLPLSISL